ncbi:acyl-CoA dehydrogenase/oxidase C-terminal [Xylogone sp. PMI_703]|nr:acyl-CoA dehydrogenase/oxidase C-terminal [Xylogone sp. PMI_703]
MDFTSALKPAQPDGATTIALERAKSSLPVKELTNHLFTPEFLERQAHIASILEKDPLFSKTTQANLSRPDRYHLGLARAKKLQRLAVTLSWNAEDSKMAEYLVDDVSPYHLHMSMFATTVRQQASDTQKAYWMPKIESWEIIGAYAQTELGHGSNVRGLELQAIWNPVQKNFILHSPTLTSSKWWNGTLGRTANHAIVVAQLLVPKPDAVQAYDNHGPHPFIVQVRDMKTHQPLKGIVVGDIGPKYGYAPMDNAYMLFDHHRIPHSSMLSRYAQLDPDTGAYHKPKNPNVVYGSLTFVRANIVMHARLVLARAVTVAVRYLSIRRQFKDRDAAGDSDLETAVLDYSSVQIRILPLLATAFALHYTGQAMGDLYQRTQKEIEGGDFAALADLHSTSSGLKSLCTDLAANGIETCRRAMGGHGFGGGSGLVQLNSDYLSKPTVEGDNWMITQQVARYLIKKAKEVSSNKKNSSINATEENLREYLQNDQRQVFNVFNDDAAILNAFKRRAAYLTFEVYKRREIQKEPYNSLLIDFHKLSRAHSQMILVTMFYNALQSNKMSPLLKDVLRDLYRLFSLNTIENENREFYKAGAVNNEQLDGLGQRILELMKQIRPHAVPLVDAWALPDYLLDSALGRYDGRVYEDLFHRAHRLNPLNRVTFNPDYRTAEIVMGSGDGGQILSKL